MNWMHIVGFLLMLSGFLTVFENFWVALLLFAAGVVVFQCGIDKAAAIKKEEAEERWRQITQGYSSDASYTSNAVSDTRGTAPSYRILDTFIRYSASAPAVYLGCPAVYRYPNIAVSDVNRDILCSMVQSKTFDVQLVKGDGGEILLQKDNCTVAKLQDRIQMASDWLDRGSPVWCEFVAFAGGRERVELFFYRDEEDSLKSDRCDTVKLTSCFSSTKQETIAFLESGEKLFIDIDDNEKPYLRDILYNPVGSLPAKYNRLYEDDLITGIFFDHSETKVSEDFDKDDKEIPFVRVYVSE